MKKDNIPELKEALSKYRGSLISVAIFSAVLNALMLVGPLFMLQVYDRVLASRSSATLFVLAGIVLFLYLIMGILDHFRGRVLARVGAGFQSSLDDRVFSAVLRQSSHPDFKDKPNNSLQDLTSIQSFLSSPVLGVIFDLPWTPLFLAVLFIFHPFMGWMAIGGAILIFVLALCNQWSTKQAQQNANERQSDADYRTEVIRKNIDTVRGLGMTQEMSSQWTVARGAALEARVLAADRGGGFTAATKAFRHTLQSAMLALGAWLVLQNELTPGAMIAGSILLGRTLAPIEQIVGQWGMVQRATLGWKRLSHFLMAVPKAQQLMPLLRPDGDVKALNLSIVPPGQKKPNVTGVRFALSSGEAMAVIGPSAAGKSSLAKVLAGIWPPAAGEVRLGGAELHQYEVDRLGQYLGYLPQEVVLFAGSVKDNIARFMPAADANEVQEAAKLAGAHEMILGLPDGYDTEIKETGSSLSGGQKQRIGLARALFGKPVLLVLDEPNSSLDDMGIKALNGAISNAKQKGISVVVMSHRPSALAECEKVLVLDKGQMRAFGPRDEVLANLNKGNPSIMPQKRSKTQ